jgi:G2/mitotic-specific cyclin 3/4
VFADVSNTGNMAHKTVALDGQKKMHAAEPLITDTMGGAHEAFLRPAQRPLKQVSSFSSAAGPQAPGRKRAAFVFQDNDWQHQDRGDSGTKADPQAASTLTVQTRQVRQYKSQPQLKPEMPILRRTQSRQLRNDNASGGEALLPLEDLTEALYEDAVEHLGQTGDVDDASHDGENLAANGAILPSASAVEPDAALEVSEDKLMATIMSEPDEYWDEEEDEIYDDGGYTTAHSFRSRGDFTTGGVTTVLHPKVTSKVLRELEVAKAFVEATRTDYEMEEDIWDVSMVAEYGEDIFEYMRVLEDRLLPNPHYMDNQTEIQWSMRSVLIDWLVQVHNRFNLLPETLFLAVNLIDRFLSNKVVSLGKLQLVGATAILVASKYEEINCPSLQEIVYMVDGGYTTEEVTKAERYMLTILNFELGWPGPMSFLRRISKADDYDLHTRTLAKYFLEVTVMDERFVGSPCSFLAAGAHCLSRFILNKGDWVSVSFRRGKV